MGSPNTLYLVVILWSFPAACEEDVHPCVIVFTPKEKSTHRDITHRVMHTQWGVHPRSVCMFVNVKASVWMCEGFCEGG